MILFALAAAVATAPPAAVPPAPTDAELREIAEDAARDLKDSRFYNRPGASRADYDAAWQECRLIARGSLVPGRTVVTTYNPNIISPAVAGAAAGVGAFIGAAIEQGALRRANRRECLLTRGWRLVEVDDAGKKDIDSMSAAERDNFFSYVVGAHDLQGLKVSTWTNSFAQPQLASEIEQ